MTPAITPTLQNKILQGVIYILIHPFHLMSRIFMWLYVRLAVRNVPTREHWSVCCATLRPLNQTHNKAKEFLKNREKNKNGSCTAVYVEKIISFVLIDGRNDDKDDGDDDEEVVV